MPNNIELITKYLADTVALNEVFKSASVTKDLETPNTLFIGTRTVKFPVITFANLKAGVYSRTNGFKVKDMNLSWQEYTLTQDLGDTLKLDKFDAEESGTAVIAFLNAYIRQVIVPTVDEYRLTQMAKGASDNNKVVIGASNKSTIISKIKGARQKLFDAGVPLTGTVLYLKGSCETAIELADELKHAVVQGNWGGKLDTLVRMIDEAKLMPVPADRWPKNVEFMLIQPISQLSVVKHNAAEFYEKVPGFRGPQIDYNMYHDSFVLKNKNNGLYIAFTECNVLLPDSTSFQDTLEIEITSDVPGSKIYYTLDGSTNPTNASTEYVGKITINATKTIKAIAYSPDGTVSSVVSRTYTKA